MITPSQYLELVRRTQKPSNTTICGVEGGTEIENLHRPIEDWCRHQHPIVPYFYTRPDKASGAMPGTVDFGLLYRGKIILVECKTRDGKVSPVQAIWHRLAELQGHTVHVVRSMDEFHRLIEK